MTEKLSCPVCENPNLDGNNCPNCETDLSLIRMLMELPSAEPMIQAKPAASLWWARIGIAVALLIIGISVGTVGNSLLTQQWAFKDQSQLAIKPNTVNPGQSKPKIVTSSLSKNSCTGFHYTVRAGDTLSQLAESFYGDVSQIPLIIQANSKLAKNPNALAIGTGATSI
ncbi:MAG: LysM peptidoglycan-binding domain-containing protein [Aphanocapsa sp. GSE-SYN-MK-11-07L]|nr:LysM peptidoglycan-binding domain-containing protein [Aphanocapsa sp. GSE-SYN-MK-11-07L]